MEYAVFEVPGDKKGDISRVTGDDLVSRQSIATRDAKALSLEGDFHLVLIEGSPEGVSRARDLFKELGIGESPDAEAVRSKIKAEEDDAADGMGLIFG